MAYRKSRYIVLAAAVMAAAVLLATGLPKRAGELPPLEADILKVGRADAIVISCEGRFMVIDAGEEDDGQEVADRIAALGGKFIDILIITHFDKDHVGGADILLERIPTGRVIIPGYEGEGAEYSDFIRVMKDKDIEADRLCGSMELSFAGAKVTVEGPEDYHIPAGASDYDNNFSLITTVTYGDTVMLFTGDAEKDRLTEWLDKAERGGADLLKVPHHGTYDASLIRLLDTVKPRFAAVCDSDKNPADPKTLELLKACGADVLETRYGRISLLTDGRNIEFLQKTKH